MKRLLLDTHIALWLASVDSSLRRSTHTLIEDHWENGGIVLLSAVSVWEIAALVDSRKIELSIPVHTWVERFLSRSGIEAVPLQHQAASRSYQLHGLEHRDAADRLLIASAIELACPLVTYDARIARFAKHYGSQCAFSVQT